MKLVLQIVEDPWWQSPFVCALIGVIPAVAAILVAEAIHQRREAKKELSQYIALLEMTLNEVDFYIRKLRSLYVHLKFGEKTLNAGKGFFTPSFKFHPELLAQARREIASHKDAIDLVSLVSECHFELSHINDKVQALAQFAINQPNYYNEAELVQGGLTNNKITQNLVRKTYCLFKRTSRVLRGEIEIKRDDRDRLVVTHPFRF